MAVFLLLDLRPSAQSTDSPLLWISEGQKLVRRDRDVGLSRAYADYLGSAPLLFKYASRRKRNVGSAKQIPIANIEKKCQPKPAIFKRLDSDFIQTVAAVAVISKSHVKPEMTQVAKGAEKNSLHAVSPRRVKCKLKHNTGSRNPTTDKVP